MLRTTSTERRTAGGDRPRSVGSVKMRSTMAGIEIHFQLNRSSFMLAACLV